MRTLTKTGYGIGVRPPRGTRKMGSNVYRYVSVNASSRTASPRPHQDAWRQHRVLGVQPLEDLGATKPVRADSEGIAGSTRRGPNVVYAQVSVPRNTAKTARTTPEVQADVVDEERGTGAVW